MSKVNYIKSLRRTDFSEWAEREFEAIERSIESITSSSTSSDSVTGTIYEVLAGDANTFKTVDSASPVNVVLPSDAVENMSINSKVQFYHKGTGALIFASGSGATVQSRLGMKSAGQYSVIFAWKQDANTWVLYGDLSANTTPIIVVPQASLSIAGHAPTVVKTTI